METHRRNISISLALNIAIKLYEQLRQLHEDFALMHGDLHHGNVMYDPSEEFVKLIDFGSSKTVRNQADIAADIRDAGILVDSLMSKVATTKPFLTDQFYHHKSAKEAKLLFESLVKNQNEPSQKIADLNIAKLQKASYEEKHKILTAARNSDRIQLVDNKQRHIFEYIALKRELEQKHGITAMNTVRLDN